MKHLWLRHAIGTAFVAAASLANVLGAEPFGEAAVLAAVGYGVAVWLALPVYACIRLLLAPDLVTLIAVGACCVAAVACRVFRAKPRPLYLLWYGLSRCGGIAAVVAGASAVRFVIDVLLGALALGVLLSARKADGSVGEGGVWIASVIVGAGAHCVGAVGALGAGLAIVCLRKGNGLAVPLLYGVGAMLALRSPAVLCAYACVYAVCAITVRNRLAMGLGAAVAAFSVLFVCGEGDWVASVCLAVGAVIGVALPFRAVAVAAALPAPSPVRQALLRSAAACRGMELAMDGDALDLGAMAGALSARLCEACPHADRCAVDASAFTEAARRAVAQRRAGLDVIPDALVESCKRASDVPAHLGALLKEHECNLALNEMRAAACELALGEVRAFAGLLSRLGALASAPVTSDAEMSADLAAKLDGDAQVYRTASGLTVRTAADGDAVTLALKALTGTDYCVEAVTEQSGVAEYALVPAPSLNVVYGVSQIAKHGAGACGDTYCVRRLRADCVIAAVCDGMGSGKGARAVSERTVSVIESCFSAGFAADEVLPLVNYLLALGGERFSCVDLAVLDLARSRATFVKMGGVESCVVRKGEVCRIEGGALPVGVERIACPTVSAVDLQRGDTVLLCTDGVTDVMRLGADLDPNPQTAADNVIACALQCDGGAAHDDMTALVLRAV